MISKKVNDKIKSDVKIARIDDLHKGDSSLPWLQAAEDARLKIAEHKKKIRLLEEAAKTFEQYAEQGQQWPQSNGTSR